MYKLILNVFKIRSNNLTSTTYRVKWVVLRPVCAVMAAVEAAVVVEAPLLAAHGTTGAHGGGAGAAPVLTVDGDGGGAALTVAANGRGVAELQPVFMTNIKMTPPTALRRHFDS